MSLSSSPYKRLAILAAATAPFAVLAGCSMESTAGPSAQPLVTVSGQTMGGRAPISSSAVTLYAAGSTGYGLAPTVLGTATSDGGGNFTITRNLNTCADPDQLYLVAAGGDAGSGTNSASVLVEALGTCSTITTATTGLVINELTTIAAAYALSGFATVDGTSVAIGTSSTNTLGLQNAFANAANIVTLNGQPRAKTASGNGTVPVQTLNTLANAIAACVDSTGTSSGGCSNLFVAPPAGTTTTTPTNTWQAALNMALYPGANVANVYTNQTGAAYYVPGLSIQPADLSVGIQYSGGFETDGTTVTGFPWDIKADASGNIWISGDTKAALVELSSTGALLSPAGGWGSAALQAASVRGLAIDNSASPNIYVASNTAGIVYKYNPAVNTTTAISAPASITVNDVATTVAASPSALGVDSNNNVWFATQQGTASAIQTFGEILAGTTTAVTSFTASPLYPDTTTGSYAMAVDATTNNVWSGSQSSKSVYYFASPYTAATVAEPTTTDPVNSIAFDAAGNTYAILTPSGVGNGKIIKFAAGSPSTTPTVISSPAGATVGLDAPRGLAIDGIGRLFVTSFSVTAAVVEFDPAIYAAASGTEGGFLVNASENGFNPTLTTNAAATANTLEITTSSPRNVTIDQAGATWVSNGSSAGTPSAVQILGIAAPTQPVLAKGQYGVRP